MNQISREHVALQMGKNHCQEYLHNVYELPSVESTIRYLHGAAGFPTKASWLKAICKGNYLSWPLINVKNVAKYFPESEETQKGHMHGQRQGVRSTRVAEPTEDIPTTIPHQKKGDILITEHEVKSLMYADRTGLFPAVSSLGNKYVMILHHVDSNSTWSEAMQPIGWRTHPCTRACFSTNATPRAHPQTSNPRQSSISRVQGGH
jgi:hypothetical protein